jgi:hypothetical protein
MCSKDADTTCTRTATSRSPTPTTGTPQEEIKRYEWEAGDVIYIPPNTIHQHFNGNPERPARLISATNRIFKAAGLNDLEQIENAPEYDPAVTLTAELIENYIRSRTMVR